ncbi:hypothetical protein J5Y03_16320 [Bacillus sp. RG28]|uniref:Flagellar protein FliT n=1 Tax=Gottfriedia endophytica TaxID=2820819 RepID=A0A940SL49_9BACI|nr:hypothetical protein [Gottfriedia endophytica]MBP0726724.1 hypothetical protein [Gottfriedia endophytica]
MDVFVKLHHVTKQLAEHFKILPQQDERDKYIETIQSLLDEREELITHLQVPVTEEEKLIGKEIMELNHGIEPALHKLRELIKIDINGLMGKKKVHTQYINPYKSLNNVSAFFDKKE